MVRKCESAIALGGWSLRQHKCTSCLRANKQSWWYARNLSPFSKGQGKRLTSINNFMLCKAPDKTE